jgi:uncharacterized protein YigA (DUF484 family)
MEQAVSEGEREAEALRARIAELEHENAELSARANRAIADAQEQTYWLARWQIDLGSVASRPGGARLLGLLRRLAPRR